MASRSSRTTFILVTLVVVAVAGFFGIRAIWRVAHDQFSEPHCTVGEYEIDTDQAVVAAQMVAAVTKYRPKLPDRAAVLVIAAGLQESKLRNLNLGEGDRDSVGVLQQRPSQGWGGGDPARLNDVTEATREFLDVLVTHKHWQAQPLADAIQDVQISADGSAYAQHEPEAQALADALQGNSPAAITCSFDKPTLVASPRRVVTQLRAQLPVNTPSASGKTISVPGAGWQTAAWFIANADRLGVDSVSYAAHRWSRSDGWQDDPSASKQTVVATMATLT